MKQVNVVQIIAELGDGGVEAMLMDIYRNIDRDKFRFVFVVQNESRRYENEISALGGKVYQTQTLYDVGVIAYIKNIANICKEEKIDVVHCHNLTQNTILLLAAKIAGVKVRISHSHLTTCFSKKAELMMPLIRGWINFFATNRLACGNDAGNFLYGNKKFTVVNNAIDISRFSSTLINGDEGHTLDIADKHVLLHVGRLSEQKNHPYLLNVMAKLLKKRDDVLLLCCGSGPLYDETQKIIDENGLQNNVRLLGSRSDIPELMKLADILLLPSLYEGFPVTLVESQASGLKAFVADTIDKQSDFGLDLVEFLPLGDENIERWVSEISNCLDYGYKIPGNIVDCLIEKGYSSQHNSKVLAQIYVSAVDGKE